MIEIKQLSESEIHITTYSHYSSAQIIFNNEKYDLVQVTTDCQTRKRTYMFVKNYF